MFRSRRYQQFRERQQQTDTGRPRVAAASFVLLGLLLGLVSGLAYAWLVSPVVYVDASPARLSQRYKEEYLFLVSQAYAANGDWARTEARLAALEDPQIGQTVAALFERYLREARPPGYVRNLALLTEAFGADSPALSFFGPTPLPPPVTPQPTPAGPTITPTLLPTPTLTRPPTETPAPTSTPAPSITPTPSPPPVYRLLSQERVCEPGVAVQRIEVEVQDAVLQPLPGVEVIVSWEAGEDRFFTGFKPGKGPGYGDFTMQPGVSYSVVLAEGSPVTSGLRIEPCDDGQDGGWRLTFQNLLFSQPTPTPTR